jgi:hypothetical protein
MILATGDSWTYGYGIQNRHAWPHVLSNLLEMPVTVSARPGEDNETICENTIEYVKRLDPKIVIIGWSGVSRIRHSKKPYIQYSLSQVPSEDTEHRKQFFKNSNIKELSSIWQSQIDRVNSVCNNVLHFSVFGDQHCASADNLLKTSMMEYVANAQKIKFQYSIPIFEFDFLHQDNIVAEEFCNREFNNNWIKACVEREELRDTKLFFNCGHPKEKGHRRWAKHLRSML